MTMNVLQLTSALKEEALRLGFDLVGAAPAVESPDYERLEQWIAKGYAAGMGYFAERLPAYRHPREVLPGVRSLLMLGLNYRTVEPAATAEGQALVSRYAWGMDYHEVIRERLHVLADFLRGLAPQAGVRGVVDTAPLLERHYGQMAGLGWIGRNTTLINERFGSWFFLAALLTTEELIYDRPVENRCGDCRACLEACPAGALVGPQELDARRCISYLTIEHRGSISEAYQAAIGHRIFGCDACQEACPWNRRTPATQETAFQPGEGMNPITISEIVLLDEEAFRRRFRHSPLWRAKRDGLLRNAAIVGKNEPRNSNKT